MTKAEAVVHQLTNKAASGDPRARREYFLVHKMLQPPEPTEEIAPDLSDPDKEVMKNFFQANGSNEEKETGRTINPRPD